MSAVLDSLTLFGSEIVRAVLDDLAPLYEALAPLLLAERDRESGIQRSNRAGAWHSRPDLAVREEAPYRAVLSLVREHVESTLQGQAAAHGHAVPPHRWKVQAWAIVMEDGGYVELHDHAHAHWSAVWYVDAGDPPPEDDPRAGCITFVDPRRASLPIPGLPIRPTTFTVRPSTASLLLFPGYLQHYVHPYRGARPRICISANLLFEPLAPPPEEATPPGAASG